MSDESVELYVDLIRETAAAILVSDSGDDVWVPKSQIVNLDDVPSAPADDVLIEIPEWLAISKGLV